MILLDGHSLTPKRRILPESLGIDLAERDGTATMVPDSMSGINMKSWFLDNTNPGKGIVYRVRRIANDYGTNTPTIELEHVISTLKDRILFGEITPEMMGGTDGKCTAKQAAQYILSRSDDWKLGTFGYDVSNPYKFDGQSLFDALVTVTKSLKDAWWSYDLSSYPFTISINPRSESVGTEMRAGRNLDSLRRTQDLSNTYTRFYPIGKDDLHISGNFIDRNTGAYGVIEHVEVNSALETEEELRRWANEKLDVHAQPLDTIELEGIELADATGESLDRIRLGRICRVPLPEYGTVIEEQVRRIRYADKVHQPTVAQVTLANEQEDIAQILAEAIKEGAGPMGAGGRGGARQEKEDHAWFEDTDTHVAMVAEGIVGKDKDGNPDWARLSQIVVDGTGIHQQVEVMKDDVGTAMTRIDENENRIVLEAKRAKAEENELNGKITVASRRIALVVTERNGQYVVNAAKIVAGINSQTGSYVQIQANKIDLTGYVTMQRFTSIEGSVANLSSGNFTGVGVRCGTLSVNAAQFTLGAHAVWKGTIKDGDGNTVNVMKWG